MNELIIILNLILLESLLSIDNATVLSIMVQKVPFNQQAKALKYGIIGAFVFRGICLFIASWLIKIMWLKIIGGLYLIWLTLEHFFLSGDSENEIKTKKLFGLSQFWSMVVMVEIMDLAFSLDNIFAAVALTNNIWLIMIGVFIGIISMRFIAQRFTVLINKYPLLIDSAFVVILFLGFKLITAGILDYITKNNPLNSHEFDLYFSIFMMIIFFIPLFFNKSLWLRK